MPQRELPAERNAGRLFHKRTAPKAAQVLVTEGEANALRAALSTARDPLVQSVLGKLSAADFQPLARIT